LEARRKELEEARKHDLPTVALQVRLKGFAVAKIARSHPRQTILVIASG
jgi:hypothetical protein